MKEEGRGGGGGQRGGGSLTTLGHRPCMSSWPPWPRRTSTTARWPPAASRHPPAPTALWQQPPPGGVSMLRLDVAPSAPCEARCSETLRASLRRDTACIVAQRHCVHRCAETLRASLRGDTACINGSEMHVAPPIFPPKMLLRWPSFVLPDRDWLLATHLLVQITAACNGPAIGCESAEPGADTWMAVGCRHRTHHWTGTWRSRTSGRSSACTRRSVRCCSCPARCTIVTRAVCAHGGGRGRGGRGVGDSSSGGGGDGWGRTSRWAGGDNEDKEDDANGQCRVRTDTSMH